MVVMTHNTDVGDSLEREREDSDFTRACSRRQRRLFAGDQHPPVFE